MTSQTVIGTETNLSGVRARFGGVDTPAALLGTFTGLGVLVLLGALIAAGAGNIQYQLNAIDIDGNLQDVEVIGTLVALVVVFVSFLCGGFAAGRMARYDGGLNGLGSGLWMILMVAVFAALGAFVGPEYNAFQPAGMPDWFSQIRGDEVTAAAIVAAALGTIAVLAGGYLGGRFGELYHRRVDAAVADRSVVAP